VSAPRGPFKAHYERSGARAYEAYEKAMGFSPCVEWRKLPLYRRNAWIEAAVAAIGDDQMEREVESRKM
jgi:hypothetical protein